MEDDLSFIFVDFSVASPIKEEDNAEPLIPNGNNSSSAQAASPTASEPAPSTCSQSSTEAPSSLPPTPTSDLVRPRDAALAHSNISLILIIYFYIFNIEFSPTIF